MDLREYLRLARRYLHLLAIVPIVIGVLLYVVSDRKTPKYSTTAIVMLRPNDPNERLGTSADGSTEVLNADRFVRAQVNVVRGPDVLKAAVEALDIPLSVDDLRDLLSVQPAVDSNILRITATTTDRQHAADIANEVALAFIDNRRTSARAGLDRAVENISEKIDDVSAQLEAISGQTAGPGRDAALETANQEFANLSERRTQLEIDRDLKRGEAELVYPAQQPTFAVSPRPTRSAIIGFVVSLALMAALVLVLDRLDDRLRTREEAEALTELNTLAEIPYDRETSRSRHHLAVIRSPHGLLAESIRSLQVSLRFLSIDQDVRVILLTSALPDDGKSTVAANLAASYAQHGARTLLVSADLRRPRAETIAGATEEAGLVDLLSEFADARATLPVEAAVGTRSRSATQRQQAAANGHAISISDRCESPLAGLFVLAAGRHVPNPIQVLSSSVAQELFTAAREQFDVVVIDSPPVVPVSDAIVLSQYADGVAVVASLGRTNRSALVRASELVAGSKTRLLGLILNRVTKEAGGYYSGYYARENVGSGPDA